MTEPTSLPLPLGVTPILINSAGRRIALHVSAAKNAVTAPPLLLIHSVNATASVIEMHAFFKRQARRRSVVALDLPGFGFSDRAPGPFTPALMVRAVQDAMEWIWHHLHPTALDVMALSVGCEFATLAALADPDAMRSLALVSPTGMERRRIGELSDGRSRQNRAVAAVLGTPGVGRSVFSALTSEWSMRWFLSRNWGSADFDRALLAHGRANARVSDAHLAPLDFVSGSLFTRGIVESYRALALPVLVAHGKRGSFTDFDAYGHVAAHSPGSWQRRAFVTGALPHLECPDDFDAAYQSWLTTRVLPANKRVATPFASPFATPFPTPFATPMTTPYSSAAPAHDRRSSALGQRRDPAQKSPAWVSR